MSLDSPDKGYIARQMLKQIGGIGGTQTLADEGVIRLLDKLSSEPSMNAKAFRAELNRMSQKQPWGDATKLAKRLVDLKAVQLGLKLQCPHCRQHPWYSVTEADYELDCPKCLQQFILPSHTPKEIDWAYRSIGPFSLPQHGYGAYTVLLALRFFSKTLDGATTPLLSFTAKKGAVEIEADLALFYQESKYDVRKTDLMFVECKSFNDFTAADAKRMSVLADQFPGAVLVFATLKKSLSKKEQRMLRPVVNRGRRQWKTDCPYNPVLILTGVELFGQWRPEQTWKDAGGKHAQFANYNSWPRGELLTLCDATQQIYLDLPPWDEWLDRRRNSKFPPLPPIKPPPAPPPTADPGQSGGEAEPPVSPPP